MTAPRCAIPECAGYGRYGVASGYRFCGLHWRYYQFAQEAEYQHLQLKLACWKERKDAPDIAVLRRHIKAILTAEITDCRDDLQIVDDVDHRRKQA
jgi:hypothetical protein